jgi:hypothetical protein
MIGSSDSSLVRRVCRMRRDIELQRWKGGARPATDAARLAAPSPLGATKIRYVHIIRSSATSSIFER